MLSNLVKENPLKDEALKSKACLCKKCGEMLDNSLCSIHRWQFNNRKVTTMEAKSIKTYAIKLKNALGGKVSAEKSLVLVPHSEGSALALSLVGEPFPLLRWTFSIVTKHSVNQKTPQRCGISLLEGLIKKLLWIKNPYYHEYVVSIFAPITMEDLRYSPRENAKKKMDLNSHHNKTC